MVLTAGGKSIEGNQRNLRLLCKEYFMRLLTIILLWLTSSSYGQTAPYQQLLYKAFRGKDALIVCSTPLKSIEFDGKDMYSYFSYYQNWSHKTLDTIMVANIFRNARSIDTSEWTPAELHSYIIVENRNETIYAGKALRKLQLANKGQRRLARQKIRDYNQAGIHDRNIFYFSRPVFDDSGKFAIVRWDNGHGGLGGGGAILLYQLQEDGWNLAGKLMSWMY